MKILFNFLLAIGIMVALGSCKGHSHDEGGESTEVADKSGVEYASAYVCPMHCKGSGSKEAGKCPVCEMDYVVNESHKADGHDHDGDDHDGDDHDGDDHDGDDDADDNDEGEEGEKEEDGHEGHNH